ncbi:MAG: membrane dipeptidase, partial [Desulfuromusa sp.]|nr:membrane dipeptidase [Desulfuromusa sp.]
HVDTNLEKLSHWRDAGVSFVSLNVYYDVMPANEVFEIIEVYRKFIDSHPDKYILVETSADVQAAHRDGKLALSFDLEGLNTLQGDVDRLDVLHGLGVRQALFAYNLNNDTAGGCHDQDVGLTAFGKEALARMNRLGILVDASHCSFSSSMEMAEHSSKPMMFSHSNPKAVCNHQRNITDDQMKACAATGGVVGACGIGIFLGENDSSSEALVHSVSYIAETIGAEHTGISLDFFFPDVDLSLELSARPDYWPQGQQYDTKGITVARPDQFAEVLQLLAKTGFSATEIRGIIGGNFLRMAREVWG